MNIYKRFKLFQAGMCSAAFLLLLASFSLLSAGERQTLSLDGVWQFATDAKQVGETSGWFRPDAKMAVMPLDGYAPSAKGTIIVPGIWDHQGYGTETPKVKHNFVGHGWYKRTFKVPALWKGTELFLTLGGISRYAKVWINGQSAGKELVGQVASFTLNVTNLVQYGKDNDITIRVDSHQRWEIDAILGASSLNDYMEIEWGGLWGHVTLESRPKERIEDLYLKTNLAKSTCTAEASVCGVKNANAVRIDIFEPGGKKVATGTEKLNSTGQTLTASVSAVIPQPKLWSPDTPFLYTVRLSLLENDKVLDTLESRYGMREIRTEGTTILLNGKPFYLRGYGDDHMYPYEFSMPTDKAMYLARLKIIKEFGFNHVRHHSTILPHEYYDACDEIGIMPTGEFPIGYPGQLPGNTIWKRHVPNGTPLEPALQTYRERFEQVVREYRRHPCIISWIMGNELWEGMSIYKDFKAIAQRLDPQRLFCDSDGDWLRYFTSGKDRDTLDLYFVLFDEWATPIIPGKFEARGFKKPVISHEAGNFITFSRPDQIDLFENGHYKGNPSLAGKKKDAKMFCNYKPFWMTDGAQKLKELGFENETEAWAKATEEIYYIHHKYNVESARLNPEISGYHWWLIQDYWTTSNGLVDLFFRPKSIAPERVRIFNNDLVLLQKGLDLTYRSGDTLKVDFFVSNYTTDSVSGTLEKKTKIKSTGYTKTETQPVAAVSQGKVVKVGGVVEQLKNISQPSELEIQVTLKDNSGKTIQTNCWETWVYPKQARFDSKGKKVYASEDIRELFPDLKLSAIPETEKLPTDAIYVITNMEPRFANSLESGAGYVLLNDTVLFPCQSIKYQQTWWKGGDSDSANHVGTFVYPTDMMKSLETATWCQPQWLYLLNGAVKYYTEHFPSQPNIHLRALPSLVRVQNTVILFDVRVGKGTLVVSGLNHFGAKGRPENDAVLVKMIERAASPDQSKSIWPRSFVQTKESVPAGMTPGYRRVLPSKYEDSRWRNFRSDNARSFVCRQTSKENYLSWQTAPAPQNKDAVTFMFAGSLGFSGQPVTDGFLFEVGDKKVLKFDIPDQNVNTCEWKSDDGKVKLVFDIRRKEPQDRFGVFCLTVPKSLLSGSGKGEKLTVRSLGEGSHRWFAINPITDLADK